MFKASDVKELRDKTGAGMLDCKKALEATNGNMTEAAHALFITPSALNQQLLKLEKELKSKVSLKYKTNAIL